MQNAKATAWGAGLIGMAGLAGAVLGPSPLLLPLAPLVAIAYVPFMLATVALGTPMGLAELGTRGEDCVHRVVRSARSGRRQAVRRLASTKTQTMKERRSNAEEDEAAEASRAGGADDRDGQLHNRVREGAAQAPPGLGRDAGDESEHDHGGEAAEGEARPAVARSGATALERGRFSVQHRPGVVVRPGMFRVGILGEDDELAHIVGPVAQRVKVERAPKRCGCRRSFDASQRIAIPNAPPTLHFASPSAVPGPRARTVHGVTRAAKQVPIDDSG